MFIVCEWRKVENRLGLSFFRGRVFSRGSLCKLNFLTRERDKGRSLPQAPSPAVAGCHPRHFDIDEGNLREHCWRGRLMRRVRARAPRGSRGPLYPRPDISYTTLSLSHSLPSTHPPSSLFLCRSYWFCLQHDELHFDTQRPCERLSCETAASFDVLLRAWNWRLASLPRYRDQMTPMGDTSLTSYDEEIDDAGISSFFLMEWNDV